MLACACDCPTDAQDRLPVDDVPSLVWYECRVYKREHGHWPNAFELIVALCLTWHSLGMTWEEAAHWIARSLVEGIGPDDPARVELVGNEHRAVPVP